MDLWVVAAAAGAGCLAKNWQNVIKERVVVSESFPGDIIQSGDLATESSASLSSLDKKLDKKKMEFRRLGNCYWTLKQCGENISMNREEISVNFDERFPAMSHFVSNSSRNSSNGDVPGNPSREMDSTSCVNSETSVSSNKCGKNNRISLFGWHLQFFGKAKNQEDGNKVKEYGDCADKSSSGSNVTAHLLLPELSPRKFDPHYGFCRSKSPLIVERSCGISVKPLTSLENCLVAQLYREHIEMEEYVFSSLPSPTTLIIRPHLLSDGKRVIGKPGNDPLIVHFKNHEHKLHGENGVGLEAKEMLVEIPPLPPNDLRGPTRKRKLQRGRLSIANAQSSGRHLHSQGLFDEMLLFCFGVCLGVMSIVLSNKTKLDKLNESLKQTKNLVQDLQEELEMKDRMTVKELVNDACQFQECNDHFFDIEELDRSYQYDDKELQVQKSRDNSESMSKIEAELEAELERLELNINTSTLERRLSGLSELDPDLIADVVHGELRADVVNGRAEDQANSEPDVSSTPHTSNYAVSPRELSLRLHQLLQSRLEERIAELETSLQQSHARIQSLESGPLHSRKRFTNGYKGSSDQESPTRLDFQQLQLSDEDEGNTLVHPLYLNLSGDAIDSYNEAYREFIRMAEIEENLTSTGDPYVQGLYQKHVFAGENGSLIHNEVMHFVREKTKTWEKNLRSRGSNEGSDRDNEDDEEGKLLIKHIVEKTRKGSPVVQNAHRRFLLSMD